MLRSIKDLIGYPLEAKDGTIGKVKDFLFDDETREIRYLVADTKGWLSSHQVLIHPMQLVTPETGFYDKHFPVSLTKKDVEKSPLLRSDEPISKQYEREYARYHNLHPVPPLSDVVEALAPQNDLSIHSPQELATHEQKLAEVENSHLRSVDEVIDYGIRSSDNEEVGHVEDLIMETESWQVHYFVVNTRNWLPGSHVIIDIDWLNDFSWENSSALVGLTKEEIKESPEYHPNQPVNREYQKVLYDYYGRPYYW